MPSESDEIEGIDTILFYWCRGEMTNGSDACCTFLYIGLLAFEQDKTILLLLDVHIDHEIMHACVCSYVYDRCLHWLAFPLGMV